MHNKAHEISQNIFGYTRFMKAATRKELNTAWITKIPSVILEQFPFTEGILNSFLAIGIIPGGKENDKARQAVFFTHLNPFGNDLDEEKTHDDQPVPQKVHYQTYWKRNEEAVYWIKLSRAQDQGPQCQETALIVSFLRTEI